MADLLLLHCGRPVTIWQKMPGRAPLSICSVAGCDWGTTVLRCERDHWQFAILRDGDGYAAYLQISAADHRRVGVAEDWESVEPLLKAWCSARNRSGEVPTYRVSLEGGKMRGIRREG